MTQAGDIWESFMEEAVSVLEVLGTCGRLMEETLEAEGFPLPLPVA